MLDCESTGLDPKTDKIITIQYQKIDNKGNPVGDLTILKEWELGEEEMLKKFHKVFIQNNPFGFVPIMNNSMFDLKFLLTRFEKYDIKIYQKHLDFLYSLPLIDIKPVLLIINNLQFKGCGLDQMTNKEQSGKLIPEWYKDKKYDMIEDYIIQETESFLEFFKILCEELPKLKNLIQHE
jgi:DNA polymerase elongation subunit (family B)